MSDNMQQSFAELCPSEKAAVMAAHYDKMCCQGKRNDIIRELQILSGIEPEEKVKQSGCNCFGIWFFQSKCSKISETQLSDSAI